MRARSRWELRCVRVSISLDTGEIVCRSSLMTAGLMAFRRLAFEFAGRSGLMSTVFLAMLSC